MHEAFHLPKVVLPLNVVTNIVTLKDVVNKNNLLQLNLNTCKGKISSSLGKHFVVEQTRNPCSQQ